MEDEAKQHRRILVTGGSGFLGRPLTAALAHAGAQVLSVSRSEPAANRPNVQHHALDLRDEVKVHAFMQQHRPQVVVHLASMVDGRTDLDLVLPTFQHNLVATVNLLLACTRLGVERVVVAASCDEAVDGRPHSPYSAAKTAATMYAGLFARTYQLPLTVARLFSVYGPGQAETKFIPYCILSMLRGQTPQLGNGAKACDWLYIDDAVRGLQLAAMHVGAAGQTIELGCGQATTLQETAEKISRASGSTIQPQFGTHAGWGGAAAVVADDSARRLIDWSPQFSLDAGLQQTVAHYRAALAKAGHPQGAL